MEKNEISVQEIKIYLSLKSAGGWISNKEIANLTKLPFRTVSSKTRKFVELGICDIVEVFPGHRYRISSKASNRNLAYVKRLQQAIEVFNL